MHVYVLQLLPVVTVSRMQSHARAVAMIGAGLLRLTLDQTAWSLSGTLIMGTLHGCYLLQ